MSPKTQEEKATGMAAVECCPKLEPCAVCDVLNFTYQLPFRPTGGRPQTNSAGRSHAAFSSDALRRAAVTGGTCSIPQRCFRESRYGFSAVIATRVSALTAQPALPITTKRLRKNRITRQAWPTR